MTYQNSNEHKANLIKAREAALQKRLCSYCSKSISMNSMRKHETSCYLNPENLKPCPVCETPIRNYKTSLTCGHSCSNRYTKAGPLHGNWKASSYRSTCFIYHEHKCVVCGEEDIVAVHHYDENKTNNTPPNLIPMCPTCHTKLHSKFRYKVVDVVDAYHDEWYGKNQIIERPYGRRIIHCS